MRKNLPKTIFCDIDGPLIKHEPPHMSCQDDYSPQLLEGTLEKIKEWDQKGYRIILTTGRRESSRKRTEKHLNSLGIIYDYLIMGIGGGDRIVINDRKPDSERDTCYAINLTRNVGIKDVDI